MRKPVLTAALVLSVVLLSTAEGTSVKSMSLEDLVKGADRIFLGTAIKRTCRANPNDRWIPIWTDIGFQDIKMLRGKAETSLVVSVGGGRIGERAVRVAGMPEVRVGQRYLVFLSGEKSPCPFLGWGQGVFRISKDPRYVADVVSTAEGEPIREVKGGRFILVPKEEREGKKKPHRLTVTELESQVVVRVRRREAAEREAEAKRKAEERAAEEGR
jgi:hypothetical protein